MRNASSQSKMADPSAEMKAWCIQELLKLTDCDDDVTGCILSVQTTDELKSYMRNFLDARDASHRKVLNDLDSFNSITDTPEFSYSEKCSGNFCSTVDPPLKPKANAKALDQHKEGKKKPARFVPLYSREGQERSTVRLPGRHPCECLGQKHSLVNNCTECGRIVCMQEGSGPCFFCGALVCTNEEREILARNSKKSNKLYEKLLTNTIVVEPSSKETDGLQKAIAHKNRLLEFDKSGIRRTKVIDDERDYFASDSNKWLSKKDREILKKKEDQLREKRHGSRKDMKVTLDFAGRKVIHEKESEGFDFDLNEAVLASGFYSTKENLQSKRVANVNIPNAGSLKFLSLGTERIKTNSGTSVEKRKSKEIYRIQDKEFQEMSDIGVCLSMHQPWASLLVLGIKTAEGRSWYTPHRGRLWIAATAQKPSDHDIRVVEEMYRSFYPNKDLDFPKEYPVSCLLGCVDVVDCLGQEEYREKFPDGESESPYVFVCENPQQLAVKFPIKGQHKIWKLDHFIHKAARAGLRATA